MPWYNKEQTTPFDTTPIEGLEFLSGAVLSEYFKQPVLKDKKYPLVSFPSGLTCEILQLDQQTVIHLFGALKLPQNGTRDEALVALRETAQEHGYQLIAQGNADLMALNPHSKRAYRVEYDNDQRHIRNITSLSPEKMELLTGEIQAAFPPLYTNEGLGDKAIAPVKFFTPDANWTWYPTEFDGEDLFFGLVSGFALELGYFSLTELEELTGPFGLALERDVHYRPRSLQELYTYEQNLKGFS